MIIVFNPQTGARAELTRPSTSSDQWSGTVAYKGRHLLDSGTTVIALEFPEALGKLTELAAAETSENGARAVRNLRFEL